MQLSLEVAEPLRSTSQKTTPCRDKQHTIKDLTVIFEIVLFSQAHQAIASRVALVDRLNPQKQTTKKV